ncbi:MAG TPA: PEP-CTERM sorting domain-containing protein, partial [Phycisphaerae bacterium]|nr:PEP-CTERM sorting domain-containing protein [Phycisphaerae bacterium]
FPVAGNYIWTIHCPDPPFMPPQTALLQIVANTTFTGGGGTWSTTIAGQWFYTSSDAVIVGSNSPDIGSPPMMTTASGAVFAGVHAFAIETPEPSTLALFGTGLLLVMMRRRR